MHYRFQSPFVMSKVCITKNQQKQYILQTPFHLMNYTINLHWQMLNFPHVLFGVTH